MKNLTDFKKKYDVYAAQRDSLPCYARCIDVDSEVNTPAKIRDLIRASRGETGGCMLVFSVTHNDGKKCLDAWLAYKKSNWVMMKGHSHHTGNYPVYLFVVPQPRLKKPKQ